MRMLEYNEMMSILPVTPKPGKGGFFSQPPACHAETRGDEDQRRRVTPTCRVEAFLTRRSFSEGGSEDGSQGKGGSTLRYQPSVELLQKTFDRMK